MAQQRPVVTDRTPAVAAIRPPVAVGMTPREVLAILRRHIWLIIIATVLGLVAGGAIWYLLVTFYPKYTARTYIEVLAPVETDPMTIGEVQVQKEILYDFRTSIANLIKQQSTLQELLGREKVKQTEWYKRRNGDIRKLMDDLEDDFVAYPHRDSDFVELSMTCASDSEAALIVNEMVDLFISNRANTERGQVAERLAQLEQERQRVERELEQAEKALEDVRAAWGITDLETPLNRYYQHTIEIRLNDLELEKNDLDLAIKQIQADIDNLERLATEPIAEQVKHAIELDPVMTTLAEQLAFQEAVLAGLLTKFGENHRAVRQTKDLIEEIKRKREARRAEIAEQTRRANLLNARDRLVTLQQRWEELERLRQEAEAKKQDLDRARIQYEQRLKIRDERITMLDAIKQQIEKLKIIYEDPDTPKVRAVGPAPRPLEMDLSRQWYMWFPGGTIMGFLLGIALAFIIELANDLVRTPSDVSKYLHIPLLGIVPDASEDDQLRDVDLCHAVREAPFSIVAEAYRSCRTNLKLSDLAKAAKTLLVTSGSAGDGKTSVASNLAATFVAEDKKVLFIDANFRQPYSEKLFPKQSAGEEDLESLDVGFGLSSLLTGQCTAKEAIRPSGIEGLDVIDAGPLPSNPAELLDSPRMSQLLDEQRKAYDYVIVDGPPVLLVSDAKVLAKLVDGTILVFNAAATRRGAAQRTIRELKEVGATVVGCVLFAARAIRGGYFHEQFKSYRRYQSAQLAGAPA